MDAAHAVNAVFSAPSIPAPEALLGRWDRPFTTPVTAIHLVLMPSSKVVLWGEPGQPWVWDASTYPADPASGYTEVPTATELFCAGHTWLPDGRLLVTGGQDPLLGHDHGIPDVNYWTGTGWSSAPPMAFGRWYPTATSLGNGSVVVVSGGDLLSLKVPTPEIYENGVWRPLLGRAAGAAVLSATVRRAQAGPPVLRGRGLQEPLSRSHRQRRAGSLDQRRQPQGVEPGLRLGRHDGRQGHVHRRRRIDLPAGGVQHRRGDRPQRRPPRRGG